MDLTKKRRGGGAGSVALFKTVFAVLNRFSYFQPPNGNEEKKCRLYFRGLLDQEVGSMFYCVNIQLARNNIAMTEVQTEKPVS